MKNIKAVAFDAFGTLVEIGDKRRPFEAISRVAQTPPRRSPMVVPMDLLAFAEECHVSMLHKWAHDLDAELASIRPYPEAREVLSAVRALGLRTAVASNLALPYAMPIADQLGDLLDVSCLSFQVRSVKPDGLFYDMLCRGLDCEPDEVLMIGDTWRCDFVGARAAGLQALHLDRRGNATQEQADVTVRDLRCVMGVVNALGVHRK